MVQKSESRGRALVALVLLVPAPTIGTWFGLFAEGTRGTEVGQAIYALSKLWILILPAVWFLAVERGRVRITWKSAGLGVGVASGLVVSGAIWVGWLVAGRSLVDAEIMRETAREAGIGSPIPYVVFAIYICTINAVLEEYVWRWFVYRKSETLLAKAGGGAVVLSALFFTVHHVVALRAQLDWLPAILAAAGVFIGGCLWSGLYLRYRSIWPGYVSHVIVDVAVFGLGAWILFGG